VDLTVARFRSWIAIQARCLCIAGSIVLAAPAAGQPPATGASATSAAAARVNIKENIASARVARVAPNRATLTVARKDPTKKLRLFDGSGAEIPTTEAPDGSINADVDPRRGYLIAPPIPERTPLTNQGLNLPARYLTFTPAGATNLGGLFLRPTVIPLTWNDQLRAYATELLVGYEFEDGGERKLAIPKTVNFFAEGANARIVENSVTITDSGGSGFKRVVLSTGQIEGETHFTARAGPVDELKSSVTVQREVGRLKLTVYPAELPAFGVGSGTLTVTLLARDGNPFPAARPLEVQLTSRRLLHPARLTIEQGKDSATADIRTTGYGHDEVLAQSGGFQAPFAVDLVFPLAATMAAMVGGAIGGIARYLRNRRKRASLLLRRILEGTIVGVIVVGAVWAGLVRVEVSTGILGTPFGAFVLAALAGYLGCGVLDHLAGKTFGTPKPA
jgi:hypothetical protein